MSFPLQSGGLASSWPLCRPNVLLHAVFFWRLLYTAIRVVGRRPSLDCDILKGRGTIWTLASIFLSAKGVWLSQAWPIRRGIVTSANSVFSHVCNHDTVTWDIHAWRGPCVQRRYTNYPGRGKTKWKAAGRRDAKTLDP